MDENVGSGNKIGRGNVLGNQETNAFGLPSLVQFNNVGMVLQGEKRETPIK